MQQNDRYQQAKMITILGALTNTGLGIIKLVGGVLFHSHALVADGIHSFSDLIIDMMVLFASKYGSQDADESHPYGHQRIETAATLFLALVLILAGIGIAGDSLIDIIYQNQHRPGWLTLPIAILSVLANEGFFHYTKFVAHKIKSDLLIANAWHHRSDAASSLVVVIGLIGSIEGFLYFDAIAAVIVGVLIIKMGWSYGWNSVKELVDTAVEGDVMITLEHIILEVPGVQKIHQLRTRLMGRDIFVDVHILVSPYISVSEGHYIAQHVHQALLNNLNGVKDVTVHVDPEDDETSCPSLHLPSRTTVEQGILQQWRRDYPEIKHWIFHYLDGALAIDLICNQKFTQWAGLQKRIEKDLEPQHTITLVRLFNEQGEISLAK